MYGTAKQVAEKICTGQGNISSGAKRIPRGKTSVLPSVAAAKALIAEARYGPAKAVP